MLIKEVISHRNSFSLCFGRLKRILYFGRLSATADGALVQHQEWDGKESTITRKLEDGKLVVVSV